MAFPLKYEARARILIKAGREDVQQGLNVGKQGPATITNVNNLEIINSEIELLRGRHLAEEILQLLQTDILYPPHSQPVTLWQKLKVTLKAFVSDVLESIEDALVNLGLTKKLSPREKGILMVEGGLKTEVIKNSNTATISFKSANPELAAKIVNTAVNVYLKNRTKVLTSSGALDFFTQETEHFRNGLQEAEQKLKQLKETKNISAIEEQKRHLLDLIAEVRTQMNKTNSELSRLNGRVTKIGSLINMKSSGSTAEKVVNPSEVIDSLKIRLTELKLKRLSLLDKHLDDSPLVAAINEEIKAIDSELSNETAISSVAVDISSLQETRLELNKAYSKLNNELKELTHNENELKSLNRDVSRSEELYKIYSDKTEESRIFQAMDTAHITNVSVVEPAYVPIMPINTIKIIPQRIFIIAMALIMSCLVSICLVALMETLDHSLKSAEDVEEHLGLPLLGVISEKRNYKQ
jgi:uncharacterized protein involved in exopolysaccharide biosynthesis